MQAESLEVVGEEGLEALRPEWAALAARLDAVPTAMPSWIEAWWRAFGDGELRIYARRRSGKLVAVLPLAATSRLRLSSTSNVHTPVFEPLAERPEDVDALLRAALGDAPAGLVLGQVEGGGPLAAAVGRLAGAGECRMLGADARPSSRVKADSWEAFEAGLRKKRLSDCRRGMRKLEGEGEVIFEIWDGVDGSRAFAEVLRLEATPWKLESGSAISQDEGTRSFYGELIGLARAGGPARLAFMRVGGKAVAVQLMVTGGGRRFGLKTGFDPAYSKTSVGVIHLFDELRTAFDAGLVFELGTGDEALKQEVRSETWTLESVGVFPTSPRGEINRRMLGVRMRAYERARQSALLRRARGRLRNRTG